MCFPLDRLIAAATAAGCRRTIAHTLRGNAVASVDSRRRRLVTQSAAIYMLVCKWGGWRTECALRCDCWRKGCGQGVVQLFRTSFRHVWVLRDAGEHVHERVTFHACLRSKRHTTIKCTPPLIGASSRRAHADFIRVHNSGIPSLLIASSLSLLLSGSHYRSS